MNKHNLPRKTWKQNHYPILKIEDFIGCEGLLIKDVAHILGRSWWTVRNAIIKLGIRDRFPSHGGESVQISMRGYNYE